MVARGGIEPPTRGFSVRQVNSESLVIQQLRPVARCYIAQQSITMQS